MNPNERLVSKLRQKQKELGLTDSDTGLQEVAPILAQPMPRQEDVEFYEQMFAEMAQRRLPLHDSDRQELRYFQQVFHLSDDDVFEIEQQVMAGMGLTPDPYEMTNEPVHPPVKFTAAPPGTTVAPQDSYSPEGSMTPTQPSKPAPAGLTPAQQAVIQRLGSPEMAGAQPHGDIPGQQPPIQATQAPPEALRSPAPTPAVEPSASPQVAAAPPETVVQPPATQATPARQPVEPPTSPAAVSPQAPPSGPVRRWWLNKNFLIPFFGLFALFTAVAVIFATSRQFFQPTVLDPQAAQQFAETGTQNLQQGQFPAAIKAFDEAVRLNPSDFNNYINRGYARHRTGDLNGAINDYNKAIELNPDAAEAFNNRSHVRVDQRQYDDAIKDATKALELNPNLPEAHVNLGNALFAQREFDKAAQAFQTALQSNASNSTKARAHNNRGNVFLARDQIQEAGSEYDQAIQLDPQYADAFFNRGIANERNQNYLAAAGDFAAAAKLYRAQGNEGRSREAQSKAERMQKQSPSTPPPPSTSNQQSI